MGLRWEDEKYVRLYTRDTVDWLGLSFIAQGLFCLILRKVDRAGIMPLGKHGRRAVAITVGFPGEWPRLEPALAELLADGCVVIDGENLLVPNFIEAQEANQSDAARKRAQRERARAGVTKRDTGGTGTPWTGHAAAQPVTECPGNVTKSHASHDTGHAVTPAVTLSCAVPSCAVPSEPASLPATNGGGRAARRRGVRLGPLGTAFVHRVTSGLGHSLTPLVESQDAGDLELRVQAHGGVEEAVQHIAATCRARPQLEPQSVKLVSDILADVLPREANP